MTDQVVADLPAEATAAPDPAALKRDIEAALKAKARESQLKRFDELLEGGAKLLAHFETMFEVARAAAEIPTPEHFATMARTDSEVLVGRIAVLKMNLDDWKKQRAEVEAGE